MERVFKFTKWGSLCLFYLNFPKGRVSGSGSRPGASESPCPYQTPSQAQSILARSNDLHGKQKCTIIIGRGDSPYSHRIVSWSGNGSFRPRVVSALSRFGPGSFRPGSIRPWVVSAQFGGSFRPIFSQLSGLLPKIN